MESTTYGDNPATIKWYRTVFGGKADEHTLEEAFSVADDTTIFVVPQPMVETFQGMTFILGKKVGIFLWDPVATPYFEFNNYSSVDVVYPYPLSKVRKRDTAYRTNDQLFLLDTAERRGMITNWRGRGLIL